jgi:hypothetical protein
MYWIYLCRRFVPKRFIKQGSAFEAALKRPLTGGTKTSWSLHTASPRPTSALRLDGTGHLSGDQRAVGTSSSVPTTARMTPAEEQQRRAASQLALPRPQSSSRTRISQMRSTVSAQQQGSGSQQQQYQRHVEDVLQLDSPERQSSMSAVSPFSPIASTMVPRKGIRVFEGTAAGVPGTRPLSGNGLAKVTAAFAAASLYDDSICVFDPPEPYVYVSPSLGASTQASSSSQGIGSTGNDRGSPATTMRLPLDQLMMSPTSEQGSPHPSPQPIFPAKLAVSHAVGIRKNPILPPTAAASTAGALVGEAVDLDDLQYHVHGTSGSSGSGSARQYSEPSLPIKGLQRTMSEEVSYQTDINSFSQIGGPAVSPLFAVYIRVCPYVSL